MVVFPEQALLGYPAKDLLLRGEVIARNVAALEELAARSGSAGMVLGYAEVNAQPYGRPLFNSAVVAANGRVLARVRKRLLPTYDVFDEVRYFEPGGVQPVVEFRGRRLGLSICEDMWADEERLARPLYDCDPLAELARAGADLLINISASPYYLGKHAARVEVLAGHARRSGVPVVFCNQVGGNDELLFDGASCVVGADGRVVAQAKAFEEDLLLVDLDNVAKARREAQPEGVASLYGALVMGLRDYVHKCGFRSVVLGCQAGLTRRS